MSMAEVLDRDASRCALVVEDDPPLRALMQLSLRRERVNTEAAGDGLQAIDQLARGRFRVLLLDLMMPHVNGWEVIDWLREHPSKMPSTVIVVTAGDRSAFDELDPEVVNAIFVKPFDLHELTGYVRRWCETPLERDRRSKRVIGDA